jgi:hypothetical protein
MLNADHSPTFPVHLKDLGIRMPGHFKYQKITSVIVNYKMRHLQSIKMTMQVCEVTRCHLSRIKYSAICSTDGLEMKFSNTAVRATNFQFSIHRYI